MTVLPGAWFSFGLKLSGYSFPARLALGVALSPVVIFVQFYALRIVGFSFETTVPLIVALNIPAMFLIFRRRSGITGCSKKFIMGGVVATSIPIALLLPQIVNSQVRLFTGHTWMQSDIVYMLADGHLKLAEPELAGLSLAYPWGAHPYQAALSWITDSAPATSYIWTNIVLLLCMAALMMLITGEMGGNRLARVTSFLWLCLGFNFIGYMVFTMVPAATGGSFWEHGPYKYAWIGGDYRITPWFLKYFFLEQSVFGHCLIGAAALILLRMRRMEFEAGSAVLLGLVLVGIGLIYPVYFGPVVIAAVLACAIWAFLQRTSGDTDHFRKSAAIGAAVVAASVITFAYLKVLTEDRVTPTIIFPTLSISSLKYSTLKALGSIIVLGPMLTGAVLCFRHFLRDKQKFIPELTMFTAGLACAAMYVLLEIPKPSAEYKFLLVAGIFLAPFPSLAVQPYFDRFQRKELLLTCVLGGVLAIPSGHKIYTDFPWTPPWEHPSAHTEGFDIRLDNDEPFAKVCESIRTKTPQETVLVVERSDLHYPTLTRRRLFAPPHQSLPHAGVFLMSSLLLGSQKGYGNRIVKERMTIVDQLYKSADNHIRNNSLQQILSLAAPAAVVLDLNEDAGLRDWLKDSYPDGMIFDNGATAVWLVRPAENSK